MRLKSAIFSSQFVEQLRPRSDQANHLTEMNILLLNGCFGATILKRKYHPEP